ncbi:MAG: PHP domain-containing protein [Acidobacteria bacterium]|nr:PHP domain-containing protein [Acidobacteriota bacterium]
MVELRSRSAFSFLEGASLPEDMIDRAAELGIEGVALLDRDTVSGAVRFHKQAVKKGVRAWIGAEVSAEEGFRYPLIAATRQGYQNLCRLITRTRLERRNARFSDIEEYADGLVCLASGPVAWAMDNGSAPEMIDRLRGVFPNGRVAIDIQRHFLRDEEARNQAFLATGLPVAAANGVSHATREARPLMDVLTCIRHHTNIQEAGRLLARNSERYFKPARQMERIFADIPHAIANARALAETLEFTLQDLGYRFPRYPVPSGESMDSFLWKRTFEGAERRYRPLHGRARLQLERELKLIAKLQLAGYFLIVWDIVEFCRRSNILVQGRGSAANSAVCYSLGITAVDPVGMDLLFERFLSEERGEWPDIDLDLASGDQREQAIQYVYQRYGERGAAMTANVISYRKRSAVRDVAKAMGNAHTAEMIEQILDLPRHLGQHSGGMVICEDALDMVVPLQPAAMPNRVIVQWDKEDCADMGIIKVDLLGLGMMAALKETIDLIRVHHKEEVDLAHLPQDDPAVYDALQRADTVGLFQVESRAQMSCLPRMRPENFYDIVVEVAIIRPGPIVGNMLHPYLRRRQGLEPAECLHPSLEAVLRRTLGVPLFQEQLLKMAMIAANFTGGEAEDLRRAMGFKRSQKRMAEVETRLRSGMTANGITGAAQDAIVQSITAFALYGFPESHAASFALITYASAYLKCHYLAAFTAALLNNQPMGFYNPLSLIKDAQRHGLRVLPVDVTISDWRCTLENFCLRLGLNYVKGLREATGQAILAARPFGSIDDLKRRVPGITREELFRLSEIGALNKIGGSQQRHRREAVWQSSLAMRPAGPLFLDEGDAPAPLAPMDAVERLQADVRVSGLSIGPHPMYYVRERLQAGGVLRSSDLPRYPNNRYVRVAGMVICRQQPETAKGFVFLSLEDETGISNIIVPPKLFAETKADILRHPYLVVGGVLQNERGAVSVKARKVDPVRAARVAVASHDFR